jgi:hypothetical protein
MSSMLAQRVAINNLAQSYMAFNTNYHDTGLFGIYAVVDPKTQSVDDLVSISPPHSHCLWAMPCIPSEDNDNTGLYKVSAM